MTLTFDLDLHTHPSELHNSLACEFVANPIYFIHKKHHRLTASKTEPSAVHCVRQELETISEHRDNSYTVFDGRCRIWYNNATSRRPAIVAASRLNRNQFYLYFYENTAKPSGELSRKAVSCRAVPEMRATFIAAGESEVIVAAVAHALWACIRFCARPRRRKKLGRLPDCSRGNIVGGSSKEQTAVSDSIGQ